MALADDLSTAPTQAADLLHDIDVHPVTGVDHRYELDIPPDWNVFYTFGGVTMAAALRAAERSIDRPDLRPLTAHAVYCAPIQAGPVEIDVDVLRNGRTAAQASVDLRQTGHEGVDLRLLTTFGQRIDTPLTYAGVTFPDDVLPPEAVRGRPSIDEIAMDEDNPFARINYHQQTEWRPALADWDWSNGWTEPGVGRTASWFRLINEPRLPDGRIDPVSLCVPADSLGSAVGRAMGNLLGGPFLILSLEIDLQFFADTTSGWLLQNVTAQHAADSYAYGTTEIWDLDENLVAIATQRARLRPVAAGEAIGPDATKA
jgi:acyl-CoA thioesterase